MTRQCYVTPELHEAALTLIARLHELHDSGGGDMALNEFARFLQLDEDALAMLSDRGNLSLTKNDDHGGGFENRGNEFQFFLKPAHIKVPAEIAGTYLVTPDSVSLMFQSEHTMIAKVFVFSAKLEDIRVDSHRLDIDLSGDSFDQCFIHG